MIHRIATWSTSNVSIELQRFKESYILRRTTGEQRRGIVFHKNRFFYVAKCVAVATLNQPNHLLPYRLPIAMVDGGHGTLTIEWGLDWYNQANALTIRGTVNTCVAVEQKDARPFAHWLCKQYVVLEDRI